MYTDLSWTIIYFLIIIISIKIIILLIIIIIDNCENRLNCICVCRGYRNRYICIPVYFICRRRINNTIIVPIKKIELYTDNQSYYSYILY